MATKRRPSRRVALLLAVAAAGVAIGAVTWLAQWPPRLVTNRWSAAIEQMSDADAAEAIAKLPEWGDAGVPVLVELLASDRKLVAQAARETLKAEMSRWRRLSPQRAAHKLAQLAHSLRKSVGQFGPSARNDARALAQRILLWPLDGTSIDRAALVADCEHIFSVSAARDRIAAGVDGANAAATGQPASHWVADHMANLSGGNLPIEITPVPLPDAPIAPPTSGIAFAPAVDVPGVPPLGMVQPDLGKPIPPEQDAAGPSLLRMAESRGAPTETPLPAEPSTVEPDNRPLAAREPLAVMRALQDSRQQMRAAAHAELLRRGFSEIEVAVARRLTDPDPAARLALVEHLPQIAGIDPEPWLLWLCRDEDPQVRLAALTLIATTGSAELLRAVEPLARQDRDPRVAELASRLFAGQGGRER